MTDKPTLADIEEWFTELAKNGDASAEKFALAAQTVRKARNLILAYSVGPLPNLDTERETVLSIIGSEVFSPDALQKKDGPGVPGYGKGDYYAPDPEQGMKEFPLSSHNAHSFDVPKWWQFWK